jgi:hypothetical protein
MHIALSLDDLGIRQPPPLVESRDRSRGKRARGSHQAAHQDLARFARETVDNLERLVAQAEEELAAEGVEFLGALIERLAAIEEDTRAQWRAIRGSRETARQVRRLLEDLPESAPGRQGLLLGLEQPLARIEEWVQAAEVLLPAYRDARWKLMALRADHEDPGDAPVFDDPDQLAQYLARG